MPSLLARFKRTLLIFGALIGFVLYEITGGHRATIRVDPARASPATRIPAKARSACASVTAPGANLAAAARSTVRARVPGHYSLIARLLQSGSNDSLLTQFPNTWPIHQALNASEDASALPEVEAVASQ